MSERKFTLVREFNGKSELVRGFDSRSELDYWAVEKHDLVKVEGGFVNPRNNTKFNLVVAP